MANLRLQAGNALTEAFANGHGRRRRYRRKAQAGRLAPVPRFSSITASTNTHYVQEHPFRPSYSSFRLRYFLFEITSNIRANSNFAISNSILIKDQSNPKLDFIFESSIIKLVYLDFPTFHNRAFSPFRGIGLGLLGVLNSILFNTLKFFPQPSRLPTKLRFENSRRYSV